MIAPPKPPSNDDAEALIKEARARQLRRRLLGAAGVAIALAIGLGVYALFVGNGTRATPTGGSTSAAATFCQASRLSTSVFFQGATQMMVGGAMLTNISGSTCALPPGRPAVRIALHGKRLSVREQVLTGSELPPGRPARMLVPHAKALVGMDWGRLDWCDKSMTPSPRFVLRFSGGLTLSGVASGLTLPGCGLGGSTIGVGKPLIQS
jgi:hypothetical protein